MRDDRNDLQNIRAWLAVAVLLLAIIAALLVWDRVERERAKIEAREALEVVWPSR